MSRAYDLPFMFSPILVTNADLVLANNEFNIEHVKEADSLANLGKSVPYLLHSQPYTSDFSEHCWQEFKTIQSSGDVVQISKKYENIESSKSAYSFSQTNIMFLERFFTRFFICNQEHLPALIVTLKDICKNIIEPTQ